MAGNEAFSQKPDYLLKAMNFRMPEPNILDFDIYLENTTSDIPLKFFAAEMTMNIDTNIANGGTLTLSIPPAASGDSSDLPAPMRIKIPSLIVDGTSTPYIYTSTRIRLDGEGIDLTETGNPGKKLGSIRIETTAKELINLPEGLKWRNNEENKTVLVIYMDLLEDIAKPESNLILFDLK